MITKLPEKFWRYVLKTETCWEWIGTIDSRGYGLFPWLGRKVRPHRLMIEYCKGAIPPGLQVDHLCRNRACVNPAHLDIVTNRENCLRGVGPAARNHKKTHCPKGHALKPENLRSSELKHGWRKCRICKNERERSLRRLIKETDPARHATILEKDRARHRI